ncbi:hypothetical protein HBH68_044410 [Parastagonospora nodorum]|nr:hypothetical protein HBH46_128340 [Parastagonospora nodorum]KAH4856535.1 hypothetical protein HBH75_074510 [Parastagonospora nodorum]KAH5219093.1 hypothetical protein HBH68_044410 [Parastagonospora nodorum]KAH5435745.1 hypothetical protein HBI32_039160 [Parastagonospora nodorum]
MDNRVPTIIGTLETLADLREDGRRRFIKRRTKEELEDIVVALLQDQDMEKVKEEGRVHGPAPIQTPIVKSDGLMADADAEDLATYKKSLWDRIDSFEGSEDDCCTPTRTPTMQARKLCNYAAKKNKAASSSPFRSVQKEVAYKNIMGGQPSTPPMRITKKDTKTPDHNKDAKLPPPSPEHCNNHFSVVLHVPGNYKDVHFPGIDQLPVIVHSELKRRLDKHLIGSAYKTYAFDRLSKNPSFYEDRPFCIYEQVRCGLRNKEFGKPVKLQAFTQGGRLGLRADDKCIEEGIPCAHIKKLNGGYVFCIVPLPKDAQKSVNWKELGFWVVE